MSPIPIFGVESSIPRECGGLLFSGFVYYDDPKWGVSFKYAGPANIHADTYLYDLGMPYITDDLQSPEVIRIFQQSCNEIFTKGTRGEYENLELINSEFLHIPKDNPDPFCLWASFTYNRAPDSDVIYKGKQMSYIALRVDRGFINKVRFSYPHTEELSELGVLYFIDFLLKWILAVRDF